MSRIVKAKKTLILMENIKVHVWVFHNIYFPLIFEDCLCGLHTIFYICRFHSMNENGIGNAEAYISCHGGC